MQVAPRDSPELFADVPDKQARNQQIHEAIRVHKYTLKEVGDFLGLYYSTKRRNIKNKDPRVILLVIWGRNTYS